MRRLVCLLYVLNLLLVVGLTLYELSMFWKVIYDWEKLLRVHQVLMAFLGFLIALWVWIDAEDIDRLEREIERLKKKLS